MKALYKYIFVLLGILSFSSCTEEEVEPFTSELGINFRNDAGSSTDINFYEMYVKEGMELSGKNIQLYVQLEGALSDQPTSFRLASQPVEDYEPVEVELPGDSVIDAGKYTRSITIRCLKPTTYNKDFKTDITFDYENSDVVPGILELQKKRLTVSDKTLWQDMMVDDAEGWNKYYASTLGKYGDVKVRFILAAMGAQGLSYRNIKYLYQNTVYYPAYGFSEERLTQLKTALEEYNASHDKPLCELDGTPVSFNVE